LSSAERPTVLLFGVHAHQPAGNFPEVIDHAHERCYRPFLRTLHAHPGFRFAAHFSGPLLDYLHERFPADMALLADMVARGQVEIFGAGETEPVLAALPERDRLSQLNGFSDRLAARYGRRPSGAWLTERVWESSVVRSLARAGIRYVTVDDYHLRCAGLPREALGGRYTTEEEGCTLDVYPISEALRYRIPFAPAPEAVAAIEAMPGTAVYFDDIEKFGVWPETHDWVYGKGWLEQFIEGVLRSPRIAITSFEAEQRTARPLGIVYLPSTSYFEMNSWTLPPARASAYTSLLGRERAAGRLEAEKPFLRGGVWRNFFMRYPESNWMHKRMLGLSARLDALPAAMRTAQMTRLLHLAQANDAYWHGLFGGLYLPHLRRAVYRSLLQLEALLDAAAPRPARERADMDLDGCDEIALRDGPVQAIVRLDGHGALVELDHYGLAQNFGDTLRRHAEAYHAAALSTTQPGHEGKGIASAHDRARAKVAIAPEDLDTDAAPRAIFLDALQEDGGPRQPIADYADTGEAAVRPALGLSGRGGALAKRLEVDASGTTARYRVLGLHGRFFTQVNLAMPSCDGVAGRIVSGDRIIGGFGEPLAAPVTALTLEDLHMGGAVRVTAAPVARILSRPVRTVSQSEDGIERIFQCVELEIEWRVDGDAELSVRLDIAQNTRAKPAP
jgi:alpha-amylase/alpha-mannosidase (GH57 family)